MRNSTSRLVPVTHRKGKSRLLLAPLSSSLVGKTSGPVFLGYFPRSYFPALYFSGTYYAPVTAAKQ
jgi:hypothetical protein